MNGSKYYGDSRNEMLFNVEEKHVKDGDVVITNVPVENAIIVLMDHPASMTVYQYVSIKVLSGSISVLGYEMKESTNPIKVFSSEKTGLIEVKTETYDRIWKKKEDFVKLKKELIEFTRNEDTAADILKKFGNYTVAIVVQLQPLPPNLQYLELYYPHVIDFNLFKMKRSSKQHLSVPRSKGTPLEFNVDVENLANEITTSIRCAILKDNPAPRVLVCGAKNTGKSTLLQFLINKLCSVYLTPYYLDTDLGQAEFTPPGVVSLTNVTKPIMGPSFAHQRKPVSMIFTGGISPDLSPDMYCRSVHKLMELYAKNFLNQPLFVNTMGWMEGLGLCCLQNVILAVKPTLLIELVNEDEVSMFDYRDFLPEGSNYLQLCRSFSPKPAHLSSQEMRNMALLSYLGKCQSALEGPVYLNEILPKCVNWDKIPVYLFGKKVPPQRMIEAINGSIVALCNVSDTKILVSNIKEYPKTLEDEPDNKCIGYGLVRAVDERKHILYVATPLDVEQLKQVNAIMKGNVMVPDAVFLNQPIVNTPLPFTSKREIPPQVKDEETPDVSMLTLKSVSDVESPAPNLTAFGSRKCYRKKPSRRYRQKK